MNDAKARGRRQSFIEFAEREKERREKQADRRRRQKDLRELEIALAATLSSPGVSIYDLLMAEYALQPQNYASHGVMRAGYLKLLYVNEKDHNKQHGARIKGDIPSQLGVSDLRGVAEVFTLSSTLREMSSVARKGLGSKMLSAVEGIAQEVAALRGSAAALIYTQADEGEIASGFWQRNGFRHSEDAAWLTTALHAWRPHEHMHYKGITSMMRSVDLS